MKDMFGNEVTVEEARQIVKRKRKEPQKRGYAAMPGTGPAGETCKTCRHLVRKRMAKTYLKCKLMRAHWTGGAGTDILASSPACREWEPAPRAVPVGGLEMTWQPIETAPESKTVWTKIDDAKGERNVAKLKRDGRLWFYPDGSMYVYYQPTHWAPA